MWCNPYRNSREVLYGCAIWALFVNVPEVVIAGGADRAVKIAGAALVAFCLIAIGRGEPMGLMGLAVYRLWQVQAASKAPLVDSTLSAAVDAYASSLLFAFVCCIVAILYRRDRIVAPLPAG